MEKQKNTKKLKIALFFGLVWIISIAGFIFGVLSGTKDGTNYYIWQERLFVTSIIVGVTSFCLSILFIFLSLNKSVKKIIVVLGVIGLTVIMALVFFLLRWSNQIEKYNKPSSFGNNGSGCSRVKPYELAPEFDRALSLIEQRESEYRSDGSNAVSWIRNCLDVQYADTGEAEGTFYFDDSVSSLEKLVIKVKSSYKQSDDLLTALLLRHELNHAGSYVLNKNYGTTFSCVDEEALAFYWQYQFYQTLNAEEKSSISSRLAYSKALNKETSAQISILEDLAVYHNQAVKLCSKKTNDEWWKCYSENMTDQVKKYVEKNPLYQKQCNL